MSQVKIKTLKKILALYGKITLAIHMKVYLSQNATF